MNIRAAHRNDMFHVNLTNEKNRQKNGIIPRAHCARNSDEKEREKRLQELRNPLNAMADKLASGAAQDMAKKIAEMKQMF